VIVGIEVPLTASIWESMSVVILQNFYGANTLSLKRCVV
jgi:hypothetical protein